MVDGAWPLRGGNWITLDYGFGRTGLNGAHAEPRKRLLAQGGRMNRFVIDTDPGVDDAHALMMAFAHPEAQIEAITTVAGNVSLERTTANACTILDVLERDVPVYAGCDRPLVTRTPDASHVHGKDGLGDSGYPRSKRRVADEHAVNALVRLANASPGELTLVALGPLTNLALATRLDPDLPHKYKRLVAMGGAIRGMGNVTSAAEFNAYTDPEAAAIVFDAWPGLTLISWETTMAHGFMAKQVQALEAHDSRRAEFFWCITRRTIEFVHHALGRQVLLAPDALAMAVALEPDIVHEAETHYVQVELAGLHTRGQTTVDWSDQTGNEPNVSLILEVDAERLWELMEAAVR
jgi:purine nucleosidase